MNDTVVYEKRERVGVLSLSRPEKFNCLSEALLLGLDDAIREAEQDPGVRALVLRAEGRHFCTGADLAEVEEQRRSREALDAFIGYGHEVMGRLEGSPLPVVAAINGYCLAGGLELLMCADVAIAAADARIGCQHAQYGLVPGWGGSQRLPRLVGLRRALDLMMSARWLSPPEALEWGLINTIVAPGELEVTALDYANALTLRNREGLAAMKRLAREGIAMDLADALKLEQRVAVPLLMSEQVTEGLAAFKERRQPNFD